MKKKILAVLLLCGLVVFGAGCRKQQGNDATNATGQGGSRAIDFVTKDINADLHPVRLLVTSIHGEESQRLEIGMKDREYYMDFRTQELGNTTLIFKKDVIYSISHDSKLVVETNDTSMLADEDPLEMFDIDKSELAGLPMATGKDEFNGQTYEYEQFTRDETTLRFFFHGQVCKGVVTTTQGFSETMIIEEYDQNIDETKLQPPKDYQTQKGI